MLKLKLLLSLMMISAFAFSQETTLNNLDDFDKVIISGNTSEVILSGKTHHGPSIIVDGTSDENVSLKIEAGVLTLMLTGNSNPTVNIFNGDLKRIEGPEDMVVSNARLTGNNGKYVVMSIDNQHHRHGRSYRTDHHVNTMTSDLEIHIPEIDLDLDIDFDEEDFFFKLNIDDDDFDFDFDFDFDIDIDFDQAAWDKSKGELHQVTGEVRHEINRALEEVKMELDKVIRIKL